MIPIKIEKIDMKVGKNNNVYCKVNDKHSCFEDNLIAILKEGIGKTYEMEVVVNGQWSNIKAIGDETDKAPEVVKVYKDIEVKPKVEEKTEIAPKQNSREFGKAGDRLKLYFDGMAELDKLIKEAKEMGLFPKEE